ncbi:MAG TPA: sugar ABC transporter permease [Chloroflexota bacterium]|jgi:multiple sugar transport system permease protein
MTPRARREALEGYLGILPWLIGLVAFTGGPILASGVLSLTQWDIVSTPRWAGLDNYVELFTKDPLFWQSLKVTLQYVVLAVPLQIMFGVLLALLLNLPVKGIRVLRTLFYVPAVLSGVAVALMWMWVLQPDYGAVNSALALAGITQGPGWFWDPFWALPSVVLMSLWRSGATNAVIYLAGLQNISPHLYEAARVDGANAWRRFWAITLPLLTPTIFFQLVTGLIDAFQVFAEVYVITQGGPLRATFFYMLYLFQNGFQDFHMGYASALAWVLIVITMGVSLVVFKTSQRWVYYEADAERT